VSWSMQKLLSLGPAEKEQLGVLHTVGEIWQQPETWLETARIAVSQAGSISALLEGAGSVVISGAGSSHYVGAAVQPFLRQRLPCHVEAIATTDIVADPQGCLPGAGPLVLVSIARSGNSPESVAAAQLADQLRPGTRHLVVTCNQDGQLARWAKTLGERGLALVLPERTNDRGLAMTSSYTSLVVACQALGFPLGEAEVYLQAVAGAAQVASGFLVGAATAVPEIAALPFRRAVFLGNGCLKGAAVESHLKLQELTAGQVVCQAESSLGLRHGPMTVIDEQTLVVHYLSACPYVAAYERDILQEIRDKRLGLATVVVGESRETALVVSDYAVQMPDAHMSAVAGDKQVPLPDHFRPQVHVMVGQLLGLFKSLQLPGPLLGVGVGHAAVEQQRSVYGIEQQLRVVYQVAQAGNQPVGLGPKLLFAGAACSRRLARGLGEPRDQQIDHLAEGLCYLHSPLPLGRRFHPALQHHRSGVYPDIDPR
jgi:tagatose-6-phosphate ketose/aldose isomerase